MRRYLYNHQNKDGGWGLHIEGNSFMLGSVLNYVTLRILGESADGGDGAMEKGRKWILDRGGACAISQSGKVWLSILGVYDWSGNNPLPPETLFLPFFVPIHPGRLWLHSRVVFFPLTYLYGKRFVGRITPLVLSLRKELYSIPYDEIDWNRARNLCAKEDLYYPHNIVQDVMWAACDKLIEPIFTHWPGSKLREKALDAAIKLVHYEDESTHYICANPMCKALNMICCWVEDPNSEAFKLHLPRVHDYLWIAEDGMKMQGYDGCQLWEAAFAVQAIFSAGLHEEYGPTLEKAHSFIKASQVLSDCPGDLSFWYRHISKGAWTFSTADQGWQVSDCTAEAVKAILLLSCMSPEIVGEPLDFQLLDAAVNVILSLMNKNGGFGGYELQRSSEWLELLNPSEVFGETFNDYPCVECTSSSIQALVSFRKLYPAHRRAEIDNCITKAAKYIERKQKSDGSWYATWGIGFTYATWFGVRALLDAGRTYQSSSTLRKACEFLLSKQLPSGGWGESYLSCENKVYTNLEGNHAHVANTSWALLSLLALGQAERDPAPLHRAAVSLINLQMENGDFPQQDIIGVIRKHCTISYSSYRNIFPIWALGEYRCRVLLPATP